VRIDTYSFGRILVDGKAYSADLILYPDHIQENWRRKKGHFLEMDDLAGVTDVPCDALIIGTGANGAMKVAGDTTARLNRMGILWEAHATGKACDRFNALIQEGKQVIAALHLTC